MGREKGDGEKRGGIEGWRGRREWEENKEGGEGRRRKGGGELEEEE